MVCIAKAHKSKPNKVKYVKKTSMSCHNANEKAIPIQECVFFLRWKLCFANNDDGSVGTSNRKANENKVFIAVS